MLAATPEHAFARFVSQPAVEDSAGYAAAHPGTRILADDVTGSELLWRYPALAGRVGFDARTEIYRPADFLRFARFLTVAGSSWTAAARGYRRSPSPARSTRTCARQCGASTAGGSSRGAGGGLVAVRS